jgi:hypothetical protein
LFFEINKSYIVQTIFKGKSPMSAIVTTIKSVEPHGENLSIVTTEQGNQVIANKRSDGSFRWEEGEIAVYISEGSLLTEETMKERGYWDDEKNRGLLDGGPRNRVKMKKLAGFESRGLLFKTEIVEADELVPSGRIVTRVINGTSASVGVNVGDDVSDFLNITEFQAK